MDHVDFNILPSIDIRLSAQAEKWRRKLWQNKPHTPSTLPFITLSRQYGCPAYALAEELMSRLNSRLGEECWAIYDRKLIEWISSNLSVERELIHSLNERSRSELEDWVVSLISGRTSQWGVFQRLAKAVRSLALGGRSILIGRGSGMITHDLPGGLHLRLAAPVEWRLEVLRKEWPERAENLTVDSLTRMDSEREAFVKKYLRVDPREATHYDLVINSARLSVTQQADAIERLMMMV
jgi:hypothetical protein